MKQIDRKWHRPSCGPTPQVRSRVVKAKAIALLLNQRCKDNGSFRISADGPITCPGITLRWVKSFLVKDKAIGFVVGSNHWLTVGRKQDWISRINYPGGYPIFLIRA